MIQLTSTEKLERAIERARDGRLFVRTTSLPRQYKVKNCETGAEYYVDFFVHTGKRYGHCSCLAGQNDQACKHLAAAAALHVGLSAIRQRIQQCG